MNAKNQVLITDNLSIGFGGKKSTGGVIYDNISVTAGKSELVALFGPNGIGKSTLLRSLVRLLSPLSGEIFLFGNSIKTLSGNEMARKVGFVSTETVHINNLRVCDLVSLGRYPYTNWTGRLLPHDREKVDDAINMVGITALKDKYINHLSDGERQRTMIARTLAQDTEIIVLDEPTAFLDLPARYEVIHLLHKLAGERGKTIVFSTHDLDIAIHQADKIWLMLKDGVFQGAPEDLILEGTFSKMFEQTSIMFDTGNGEFRIQRKPRGIIGITGPKEEYRWTRNALERLGYGVVGRAGQEIDITIDRDSGERRWEIHIAGNKKQFRNIYGLCNFLAGYQPRAGRLEH